MLVGSEVNFYFIFNFIELTSLSTKVLPKTTMNQTTTAESDHSQLEFVLALALTVSKNRPAIDPERICQELQKDKNSYKKEEEVVEQIVENYLKAVDQKQKDAPLFWKNKFLAKCKENEIIFDELRQFGLPFSTQAQKHGYKRFAEQYSSGVPNKRHRPNPEGSTNEFQSDGQYRYESDDSFQLSATQKHYAVQLFLNLLYTDSFVYPACLNICKTLERYIEIGKLEIEHVSKISAALQEYDRNSNKYSDNLFSENQQEIKPQDSEYMFDNWLNNKRVFFGHVIEFYYLCFKGRHDQERETKQTNSPNQYEKEHEKTKNDDLAKSHKLVGKYAIQTLIRLSICNIMSRYSAVEELCNYIIEQSILFSARQYYHQQDEYQQRVVIKFIYKVICPVLAAIVEPISSSDLIALLLEEHDLPLSFDTSFDRHSSSYQETNAQKVFQAATILNAIGIQISSIETLKTQMIETVLCSFPDVATQKRLLKIRWNILS